MEINDQKLFCNLYDRSFKYDAYFTGSLFLVSLCVRECVCVPVCVLVVT